MAEAKGNSATFNRLLADTHRHLRNVNERTLRPSYHHLFDIVVLLQVLLSILTGLITSQVELTFNHAFKGFTDGHTRLGFKSIVRSIVDDPRNL